MRARQPDRTGTVTRDGVNVVYDVYDVYGEEHRPAVFLLPTWAIVHSMHWKAQIPVLARRFQVLTMDPRGNGRSDRPKDPKAYVMAEQAADVIAAMDASGTDRATVAGISRGGVLAAVLASKYPDRVHGAVLAAPSFWSLVESARSPFPFDEELDADEGWALYNRYAWRRDFGKFHRFFFDQCLPEPHSTKPIEDAVGWASETDVETLAATVETTAHDELSDRDRVWAMLRGIDRPVLLVHGTKDWIAPYHVSESIAAETGWDLLTLEGCGHLPQARDPVRFNRALIDFVERVSPISELPARSVVWTRAMRRPKRVLYLSSPIGLGHARRDLAIVRALREQCGDVQVDWLAQEPVTTFLEGTGETVHPASTELAGESAHVASEAHEHDLNAFQAIRRMDEILVSNFSVFQDLVDSGDFDLVVGDEAWDVDHFWHENPELKRTAFAWMTDFVGWLPMPEGGEAEAVLTADYNAEMLEHIDRFKRVRDRSIFVGDPDDIVPDDFGPGLPNIREWTEAHFDFSGYITGFAPDEFADKRALRHRLGYDPSKPLVVVTVGGSGVGDALLRKVIDAYPLMCKEIDGLQVVVVAGPRIDPTSLPSHDGVDIRGYVPDMHLHLGVCDAAIVQGGLTSTMELVANGRPFLYFPLGGHFEQQRHVRHRLDRHNAGRCMSYSDCDPESIAVELAEVMATDPTYLPVPGDGATRAASLLRELL